MGSEVYGLGLHGLNSWIKGDRVHHPTHLCFSITHSKELCWLLQRFSLGKGLQTSAILPATSGLGLWWSVERYAYQCQYQPQRLEIISRYPTSNTNLESQRMSIAQEDGGLELAFSDLALVAVLAFLRVHQNLLWSYLCPSELTHQKDWALWILKVKVVRDSIQLTGWQRSSNRAELARPGMGGTAGLEIWLIRNGQVLKIGLR